MNSLLQVFESSGISLMADSQYNGETRVQVLLEFLQVRTRCFANIIYGPFLHLHKSC